MEVTGLRFYYYIFLSQLLTKNWFPQFDLSSYRHWDHSRRDTHLIYNFAGWKSWMFYNYINFALVSYWKVISISLATCLSITKSLYKFLLVKMKTRVCEKREIILFYLFQSSCLGKIDLFGFIGISFQFLNAKCTLSSPATRKEKCINWNMHPSNIYLSLNSRCG